MTLVEKKLSGSVLYTGLIVNVRRDVIELPDGKMSYREVVEHSGGVTVLPVDENGMATCVRQFRYPKMKEMLEAPAGKLEKGEVPLECAIRELSEETGYTADEMIYLGECCTSPGYSTETLHIYLALGLHEGEMHLDEGEFLNVERHHIDDLVDMVMKNEISDAKTTVAVLKAKMYLDTLRAQR